MTDELRETLGRLPNKRAAARAFAEHRDRAPDPAWAALWALLAAETADLDSTERAAFNAAVEDCWAPRDGAPC